MSRGLYCYHTLEWVPIYYYRDLTHQISDHLKSSENDNEVSGKRLNPIDKPV